MLSRRLQVLLDEERFERLEWEAARRRVAVAVLVRDAIDASFPPAGAGRRAAGQRVLEAAAMEVLEPADLAGELDELRAHRR